jgi:hypothetical protein
MQIIGGIVAYEDGVKNTMGDSFSPTKKVRVELNFSLDLGEGVDQIQAVLDTAQSLTLAKLGLKVPTASAKAEVGAAGSERVRIETPKETGARVFAETAAVKPETPTASAKATISDGAGTVSVTTGNHAGPGGSGGTASSKRGPGRPAKTDKDKLAEAAGVAVVVEPEKPKRDPAAIVDDVLESGPEMIGKDEEDPFAVAAVEEYAPISDDELNSAVGKKNAKLNKPPAIRDLISTFKPEGWTKQFTMRDIPQTQRAHFLTRLEELK